VRTIFTKTIRHHVPIETTLQPELIDAIVNIFEMLPHAAARNDLFSEILGAPFRDYRPARRTRRSLRFVVPSTDALPLATAQQFGDEGGAR
jgi:hypothetical protein